MPGLSDEINCIIALAFVVGTGYLIYQIDRRVKREGALFRKDASPRARLYALLVGALIGSFVILGWIAGCHLVLPLIIVSIALIGYSGGFDSLLELLENLRKQ